ncbi:hypothetical protein GCM10009414_23350 [Tatumella terrea]|uniref:Wzz/FepE/Etk N-terminal domain-containing protein n=1 Tax=Tatumella terrea TaxID=419007 RepID=UPI0031D47622
MASSVENELDIALLFRRLWRGKTLIAGVALAGVLLAAGYAHWARQVWSSTAIVDRPQLSQLAVYYDQRQLLTLLEGDTSSALNASAVCDEVYQEFLLQLSSWDSRRDFWRRSDYFRDKVKAHPNRQAMILDRLISDIRFQPADAARGTHDTVILLADNAAASSHLLSDYVSFASQRAVAVLNSNLREEWQSQWRANQVRAMKSPADAGPIAAPASSVSPSTPIGAEPRLSDDIRTWRYLRSPEPPVSRESPRLVLLMVMWGVTGAIAGAIIAISRRQVT